MKRLYRSRKNRKIAGICGGLGEYLDIDPTVVRVVSLIVGIGTGVFPFLIGYVIAWMIIPEPVDSPAS
jgi:phage shock protein C